MRDLGLVDVSNVQPFAVEVDGLVVVSDEIPATSEDVVVGAQADGPEVAPTSARPGGQPNPDKPLRWKRGATASRRAGEIRAYIGLNGHGKSLAMVKDIKPSLDRGRSILSTVKILDPYTGNAHPLWVRITDWIQLLEFAGGADVLFDEILGIASSRASASMPAEVSNFLHQLRRKDMTLSWSAPSWTRADVTIREVTKRVTVCRGYFEKIEHVAGEDDVRSWGNNRLFRFTTYDAADFTEWTDSKESKLTGKGNEWMWRPGSWAEKAYDTFDAVDRIGEVLDSGRCATCGGVRRAQPCRCGNHGKATDRHTVGNTSDAPG